MSWKYIQSTEYGKLASHVIRKSPAENEFSQPCGRAIAIAGDVAIHHAQAPGSRVTDV